MKRIAVYLLLAGSGCFVLTLYFGLSATTIYGGGIHTRGIVTRLERDDARPFSESSETWYSVVQFEDSAGKFHESRTAWGSSPSEYNVGDSVEVAYLKNKPAGGRIVSGTDLFGRTIFSSLVSNILFFSGVCMLAVMGITDRIRSTRRTAKQ